MFEIDKDTKQLLQGTIDSLTSHIAILDRAGNIIEVNRAWREFAELNAFNGKTFGVGSNYIETCHPSDRDPHDCDPHGIEAAKGILNVINGSQSFFELEYPCHSPSEYRWFIMRVTCFGKGENLNVVVAHEDITKRKKAELALQESEAGYRILAETASDAIIRIDENSRIQFINHAGERIFGYKIEEMIGQSLALIMPEEMRAAHQAGVKHYLETGEPTMSWKDVEFPARHRDGHIFPLEVSFSDYKLGDKHFFIGIARDVSERKQIEKATAHLAAIVESSDDAIISKNLQGTITSWNKGAEKIFGYTAEEVIGKPIYILIPPQRINEEPLILERIARGEKIDHYETVRRRKDGTEINISLTVSPIFDKAGNIIGASKIARDVTERKRTEETLRENQTMLSLAMKSSRMGAWERDVKTNDVYWSEELEDIFGLEKDSFSSKRASFYELMHEDDREKIQEEVDKAVAEQRDYTIEFRFYHADGSIRWMEGRGQAIYDQQGEPVRLYGIGIDITGRKRAEQALRESENSLRTLADSVPQLVWMAEPDGSVFWYNERWYQYTGTTAQEMEGWGWQSVHDPKILPEIIERWKYSIETGEPFEMEFPLRGADGVFRWFLTRIIPLRDVEGRIVRWFGTNTDIDESRQMRDALQESEKRFRMMSNNAPMLVWMSGTDKLRTYFNQTWLDFTGRTMEEELGNGWTKGIHPEDYDHCMEIYRGSFDAREEFEMEFRLRHFDGDYCWLLDRGVPLFTPEGVFKGYIGSCVDVTERKEAEQKREEILRREHAARLQAEAASRAKDEFLSVLSHELRTPLNSMFGWIRMLRAGMLDENRAAQAFEVIERNVKLQNNLIEDLLDVSRIITGKMRIESEKVDFVSIVKTAVEAARPTAESKNIKLELQTGADSMALFGDANRLQQIVNNLINNAIKFTPQDGSVKLNLSRQNGKVKLEVRDTGIGISKEFLPMIFDRFKQADSTTKRAHSGLGLGLTIVKNLTELHGGTVEAFSEGENSGASFVIELPPYVQSETDLNKGAATTIVQTDGSLDGAKILLVDDDCDGLMPLQIFLEMHRAEVECADSAHEALDKLAKKNFDVLISDIGMPGMDGYELMAKIRQSENGSGFQIPAIALTAYASTQDRQRALAAGFQYHLAKPIDFDHFILSIKNLLKNSQGK